MNVLIPGGAQDASASWTLHCVDAHWEAGCWEQADMRLRYLTKAIGSRQAKSLRKRCDGEHRSDGGRMTSNARSWACSKRQICVRALLLKPAVEEPLW
jgi:hypothetical protein